MWRAVAPIAGALEFLAALPPERWTVVTSAPRALARARLGAAGIPVPDTLVTGEEVSAGKPAPDCFLLGARRLGFETAECIVFEDSAAGVEIRDSVWRRPCRDRVGGSARAFGRAIGGPRLQAARIDRHGRSTSPEAASFAHARRDDDGGWLLVERSHLSECPALIPAPPDWAPERRRPSRARHRPRRCPRRVCCRHAVRCRPGNRWS